MSRYHTKMEADVPIGTDLALGDACSVIAFNWAQTTSRSALNGFSLGRSFAGILSFGQVQLAIASDGIGTKVELAERLKVYDTLGYDLVAMVTDDLICCGARPTHLSNILDVDHLDSEVVDALMRGLAEAAREAKVVVTGGEIAELGDRIRGFGTGMHFNWCATALGLLRSEGPVNGRRIRPGDIVLALPSAGFRSNGFSLARRVLKGKWTKEWARALLTPSRLYALEVQRLLESSVGVHGIAHITGGGIPGNLPRILHGYGAELDRLFAPHEAMIELQKLGKVSEEQAYRHWNMGQGMLVVVAQRQVDSVLECLSDAKIVGHITDGPLVLRTRGAQPQTLVVDNDGS